MQANQMMQKPLLVFLLLAGSALRAEVPMPEVNDPQFELSLFAAEPDIVTPIGITVDNRNRIFVVESHTHRRKADYAGPKQDRIKFFEDSNSDGKADRISVFAEVPYWAMNIVFAPNEELFLSHRNGIVILHDKNADGVSDGETKIIECDTPGATPHNGIGGIAFGVDGWLYFGMGENRGEPYTIKGSDGASHSGGGEGGKIFRCQPNGSQLQLVARGFWNPFGLEFDRSGRLLCVDNDPHSRPPCRLLHVVPDGDYGYQFRFAANGLHPFIAWNGELPGTLPMMSGTGEGTAGVLDGAKVRLPKDYEGALFVTAWGDHSIEYYFPKPHGASFRAERRVLVQGNEFFRPNVIAAGADGNMYFTDWVKREYEVHGMGRIWRLKTAASESRRPNLAGTGKQISPAEKRMTQLQRIDSPKDYTTLLAALREVDPFIVGAAISALSRPVFREKLLEEVTHREATIRLGALLALRRTELERPLHILEKALADPDEKVRLMALIWTGEQAFTALANRIQVSLSAGSVSPLLFQAYAATAKILAEKLTKENGAQGKALAEKLVDEEPAPAGLRAMVMNLSGRHDDGQWIRIFKSARDDLSLRVEAVRSLADSTNAAAIKLLQTTALNKQNAELLRAEAVLALAGKPPEILENLIPLLADSSEAIRMETARAFRVAKDSPRLRAAIEKKLGSARKISFAMKEQFTFLGIGNADEVLAGTRPATTEDWRKALGEAKGNAEAGRRVFFHPSVGCARCHRIEGHGGSIGPDLSAIARSAQREKLLQSILNPSGEIAPEFLTHTVETKDGESYTGLMIAEGADGAMTLTTADGKGVLIRADQIVSHQPGNLSLMPKGLEKGMTVQEFRDVVAFLLSRK